LPAAEHSGTGSGRIGPDPVVLSASARTRL